MLSGAVFGHNFTPDWEVADFLMPRDLKQPRMHVITTAWCDAQRKGQTMLMVLSTKSCWGYIDNPPKVIATHTKKKDAVAFHQKTREELLKGGYYG
jgi:hypothetical protein